MNNFNDGVQERLACTGLFTNMECEMYQILKADQK